MCLLGVSCCGLLQPCVVVCLWGGAGTACDASLSAAKVQTVLGEGLEQPGTREFLIERGLPREEMRRRGVRV
jgi:hypothetical protein